MKLIDNYPQHALETMAVTTPSLQPHARGVVPYSPRWYTTKMAVRASILILCALTWVLIGHSLNIWGIVIVPVMLPDIVWQSAEFVVLARFHKTKKRGIHPVAHLVWDLLFWMGYFVIAVLFSGLVIPAWVEAEYKDQKRVYSELIACAIFLSILWYALMNPRHDNS